MSNSEVLVESAKRIGEAIVEVSNQINNHSQAIAQIKQSSKAVEYGAGMANTIKAIKKDIIKFSNTLATEELIIVDNIKEFLGNTATLVLLADSQDDIEKVGIKQALESITQLSESINLFGYQIGTMRDSIDSLPNQFRPQDAANKISHFCDAMDSLVLYIEESLTDINKLESAA